MSDSVFSPTSRSDQKEDRLSPARFQHHEIAKAVKEEKGSKKEKKLIDPVKMDQNAIRRASENVLNIFKKDKNPLSNRVKSVDKEKDEKEKPKEVEELKAGGKEGRKNNVMKGVDVRTKKVLKEGDDAKKVHENNLSSSSLTFTSGISKTFSPSHNNTSSTKNMTMYDPLYLYFLISIGIHQRMTLCLWRTMNSSTYLKRVTTSQTLD